MLAKPCVLENTDLCAEGLEPGGMRENGEEGRGLREEADPLAWSWRNPRGRLEQVRAKMDGVGRQ